jgi:hypothetical protein
MPTVKRVYSAPYSVACRHNSRKSECATSDIWGKPVRECAHLRLSRIFRRAERPRCDLVPTPGRAMQVPSTTGSGASRKRRAAARRALESPHRRVAPRWPSSSTHRRQGSSSLLHRERDGATHARAWIGMRRARSIESTRTRMDCESFRFRLGVPQDLKSQAPGRDEAPVAYRGRGLALFCVS